MTIIPFLFIALTVFVCMQARHTGAATAWALMPFIPLALWGGASTWMAFAGVYDDPAFLGLWPGLWLPAVPMIIGCGTVFLIPSVLGAYRRIVARSSQTSWIAIQILRLAALGTLVKTFQGTFPLHVELAIGLTDLAYAVSAIILYRVASRRAVSNDALIIWHAVGILIILIPAGLTLQSNQPGPLLTDPTGPVGALFDFPMVLAPSLVVPMFLMVNILGLLAAAEDMKRRSRAGAINESRAESGQDP